MQRCEIKKGGVVGIHDAPDNFLDGKFAKLGIFTTDTNGFATYYKCLSDKCYVPQMFCVDQKDPRDVCSNIGMTSIKNTSDADLTVSEHMTFGTKLGLSGCDGCGLYGRNIKHELGNGQSMMCYEQSGCLAYVRIPPKSEVTITKK